MLRGFIFMFLTRTGLLRVITGLMTDRRVSIKTKLIIPAAIIYLLSPFDLVPDFIPISGWIDDLLVITFATALFLGTVPKGVVWEHIRGRPAPDAPNSRKDTIEGDYRIVDDEEGDKEDDKLK